jgi:hypothetical protein
VGGIDLSAVQEPSVNTVPVNTVDIDTVPIDTVAVRAVRTLVIVEMIADETHFFGEGLFDRC